MNKMYLSISIYPPTRYFSQNKLIVELSIILENFAVLKILELVIVIIIIKINRIKYFCQ